MTIQEALKNINRFALIQYDMDRMCHDTDILKNEYLIERIPVNRIEYERTKGWTEEHRVCILLRESRNRCIDICTV
jgi:hypothetical protein